MKTQNEKLQDLVNQINKFSKEDRRKGSAVLGFRKGYYKGSAESYELTAKWIQEIIDDEN